MHVRNKFLGSAPPSGNPTRRASARPLLRPWARLLASGGLLSGGAVTWASPTVTTLATFNVSTTGSYPTGLIADAAGNLYGATSFGGGPNDFGTVFEIASGTHTISTLVTFNVSNGANPFAGLMADAAGNLYGTTGGGGASDEGTVFQVAAGNYTLTTLAAFNKNNGAKPESLLIADAAGNLYGTTNEGGAHNYGTVFEVAAGTHALTTLATFDYNTNGAYPFGSLIADAAGNLYGTTEYGGGPNNRGTVFKIAVGTHTLTTIITFDGIPMGNPRLGLVSDGAGSFYGASGGGIFKVSAGAFPGTTYALSTVVGFNDNPSALIVDAAGNLYGTTTYGGPNNDGTAFEVVAGTHALTTLATFDGTNGYHPAGLIADTAGNLYGPTGGAPTSDGTVFELAGTGFVTSTPEPTGLSLIGLAGVGLLARRRSGRSA